MTPRRVAEQPSDRGENGEIFFGRAHDSISVVDAHFPRAGRVRIMVNVRAMASTRLRVTAAPRFVASLAFALVACGGGQQEASETPESPPAAEAPSEAPAAESTDTKAEAATESSTKDKSKETNMPEPKRSPKDLLTAEGTLFSFSFKDSEMYQSAEADCSKKSKDDPAKKADCLNKAREKFEGESMFFKQTPDGKWEWTTIKQAGNKTAVLHKVEVEFADETATSITIKPKGKATGSKPRAIPPKGIVFEVNDMGITLTDPQRGKMVYVAKLGAVGDSK